MVSPPPNAVRQSVMVLAIGCALYAQLAVHQTPTDTAAWGILAVAALLAAIAAGARRAVDGAAVPPAANPPSPAVRLGFGALAVAAIAVATYLSTTEHSSPVLALLCWLSAP